MRIALDRPEEFIADWDRMIGTISDFADKYDLPKPEIVIHPDVQMTMNAVARERIAGTLIYRGVKARTGIFELGTVLREFK